ncbi:hypothetical protein bcgnr5380_26630 [Bacillus cereus]
MYHPKLFTYSGLFPNNVTYTIKGKIRIAVDVSKYFFSLLKTNCIRL